MRLALGQVASSRSERPKPGGSALPAAESPPVSLTPGVQEPDAPRPGKLILRRGRLACPTDNVFEDGPATSEAHVETVSRFGILSVLMNAPTILDLFCGAGGISHGFEQAGFRVLAGVDFDEDSVQTFIRSHKGAKGLCADLSKYTPEKLADELGIRPGQVDCIAGGPPCQGFSKNRAFRHKDGTFVDDPRNHLYWHFFEFVGHLQPRLVLMENVPEILIKSNGYFRDAVFERFHALGYEADARVLNAAEYGVPQWRRRAIFIAGLDGLKCGFPPRTTLAGPRAGRRTPTSRDLIVSTRSGNGLLPLFDDEIPVGPCVWDAISDLQGRYAESLEGSTSYCSEPANSYQKERRGDCITVSNHFPWKLSQRQIERIRLLGEGQGLHHLPEELKTKDGYGSAYRRLQREAQALTITTWMFHPGSGMFTHPIEDRVVTIREAARLQSFQDDFVFTGRYHSQCRQVGNSVAPLLAKSIALEMKRTLGFAAGMTLKSRTSSQKLA